MCMHPRFIVCFDTEKMQKKLIEILTIRIENSNVLKSCFLFAKKI